MDNELKNICQAILDNEDKVGWKGDLTVTSLKAINKLRKYMNEQYKSEMEAKRKLELIDLREKVAQERFENDDLDGLQCEEQEGWETDGDTLLKKFYYENDENPEDGSKVATFAVVFKKDTDKVLDSHVNT